MRKSSRSAKLAEKRVAQMERSLMKQKEKLARLRRKVPPREIPDHTLALTNGKSVKLSALFGKNRELVLIHNMGSGCPYCTLWADGFNGVLHHLESRVAFAMESPDSPASQKKFASSRRWKFRMVSSHGTSFRRQAGFETRSGEMVPGVSVFAKDAEGRIFQISRAKFGPGDNFCNVWDLFDLLPKGSGSWQPKYRYSDVR